MIIVTSFVLSRHSRRNDEFLFALTKNSENVLVDAIHILTEDASVIEWVKGINKIYVSKVDCRPTFRTIVDYANTISGPVAIINSDIFLDDSLVVPPPGVVFCLTRWTPDVSGPGPWYARPWVETNGMSFDTYIFNPPIKITDIDFHLGTLGCDGKFAYELHNSGLQVVNPSAAIRSYHVHASAIREYGDQWVKGSYLRIGITDSFEHNPKLVYVHRTEL